MTVVTCIFDTSEIAFYSLEKFGKLKKNFFQIGNSPYSNKAKFE